MQKYRGTENMSKSAADMTNKNHFISQLKKLW